MTVLAVAIVLLSFLLLRSIGANWTDRVEQTPDDRVVSVNKLGLGRPIPVRYLEMMRGLDDLELVVGGVFPAFALPGDQGRFIGGQATFMREFLEMHRELIVPEEQEKRVLANRRGAVVGYLRAEEEGWKLGDRITLESRRFGGKWELEVSAIAHSTRYGFGEKATWLHYEYFNAGLPKDKQDTIDILAAQIGDPAMGARIAKAIDMRFDTEDPPLLTQEDKALQATLVGQFGAILEATQVISFLVLGIVLLIIGNTLALATRERTAEYGTLRAIGFQPSHLWLLVLAEATFLGVLGALVGLGIGFPLVQGPVSRFLEESMNLAPLRLDWEDVGVAIGAGIVLGLGAALLPARAVARLNVRDALSRVA